MRVRDGMLKTVVFIGTVNDRGDFVPNGTGCLISCGTGGRMFQHIATCWHVVRGIAGDKIWIRVNDKEGKAVLHWTHKDRWFKHPDADGKDGKFVDLCMTPVTIKDEEHDILHIPIDKDGYVVTDQVISEENIGIGDEIYSVGLFTSHYGEVSNIPVARCGTIASMPREPIETSDGFVEGYLIEMFSLGGVSGAPVFAHMAPLRVLDGTVTQSADDHYFLGIIQGHFKVNNPLDVVTGKGDDPLGTFNTGMCVVIPAKRILEVVNLPSLQAEREEIVQKHREKKGFVSDSAHRSEEPPTKADNPRHEEDFNRLLDAAAKGRKSGDQS